MNTHKDLRKRSRQDHVRLYLESQTIQNKKDYFCHKQKTAGGLDMKDFSLFDKALKLNWLNDYVLTRMLHGSTYQNRS